MDPTESQVMGAEEIPVDTSDLGLLNRQEVKCLGLLSALTAEEKNDHRALAIAKTHVETAFLWARKSLRAE